MDVDIKVSREATEQAYKIGQQARLDGNHVNPYTLTMLRSAWVDGWMEKDKAIRPPSNRFAR